MLVCFAQTHGLELERWAHSINCTSSEYEPIISTTDGTAHDTAPLISEVESNTRQRSHPTDPMERVSSDVQSPFSCRGGGVHGRKSRSTRRRSSASGDMLAVSNLLIRRERTGHLSEEETIATEWMEDFICIRCQDEKRLSICSLARWSLPQHLVIKGASWALKFSARNLKGRNVRLLGYISGTAFCSGTDCGSTGNLRAAPWRTSTNLSIPLATVRTPFLKRLRRNRPHYHVGHALTVQTSTCADCVIILSFCLQYSSLQKRRECAKSKRGVASEGRRLEYTREGGKISESGFQIIGAKVL